MRGASQINVTSVDPNTAATLGFSVVDGAPGVDVAGTINGKAATGAGQLLTANAVTDNGAEGLSLTVTGSSTGARGSVNFTRGVTDRWRGSYRTIRSSPASALPRMKLSASCVGMRTPVIE